MKLDRRIEEAVPTGQQLQELGMRLRCDDTGSEPVSFKLFYFIHITSILKTFFLSRTIY